MALPKVKEELVASGFSGKGFANYDAFFKIDWRTFDVKNLVVCRGVAQGFRAEFPGFSWRSAKKKSTGGALILPWWCRDQDFCCPCAKAKHTKFFTSKVRKVNIAKKAP